MSDKKENTEDTFELSDLFTKDRMNDGMWFIPYANNVFIGVKFKVIGVSSPKVMNDYAKYTIDKNSISVADGFEKAMEKQAEINAEFASKLIIDIETQDGRKIVSNGKDISDLRTAMKELFLNNTFVAELIIDFASNDFNYIAQ